MSKSIKVKFKIANVIIEIRSAFKLEQFSEEERELQRTERFDNFSYKGDEKPEVLIDVDIVDRLPEIKKAESVFITYHFQDGKENWRLLKKGNIYIYKSPLKDKKQLMVVNKSFDKVEAYLLPNRVKGRVWNSSDIIYDFLQVLLINYFAKRKDGIFVHAVGIKDLDGSGLLFAGKSGAGKSTTARLWHNHSKALVLNDDRIIVRKFRDRFFAYGSPWHGDFSDYLASRIESAALKKLFFIYHSNKNSCRKIFQKEAFNFLYPTIFPTFWDRGCLENITSFSLDLIKSVPSFSFGFVNDKRVIGFTRDIGY